MIGRVRGGVLPLVLTLAAATLACGLTPEPAAQAYLFEKGPYQALYGDDGQIRRLLHDSNHDRVADYVVLYEGMVPRRVEIDEDLDGAIDRWEDYDRLKRLVRVARARRTPGVPDLWESSASGHLTKRELDEDADGRVDRIERFVGDSLARVEMDTDRDGHMDRWQIWGNGRLVRETLDVDADGVADRALDYGPDGGIRSIEKLAASPLSGTK
jgi:hypothetical protein